MFQHCHSDAPHFADLASRASCMVGAQLVRCRQPDPYPPSDNAILTLPPAVVEVPAVEPALLVRVPGAVGVHHHEPLVVVPVCIPMALDSVLVEVQREDIID